MSNRHAAGKSYKPLTVRKRNKRRRKRLIIRALVLVLAVISVICIVRTIQNRNRQKAIQAELAAYADTFQPGVTINGTELTGCSYEEAEKLLAEKYASTIDDQVILTFEDKSWTFSPEQMGAQIDLASPLEEAWAYGKEGSDQERLEAIRSLAENPVDLSAELTFDETVLNAFVDSVRQEVDRDPVSATRTIVGIEKFEFTDSAIGYRLDAEKLEQQLTEIILTGGAGRMELEPEIVEPEVSRSELEASTVLLAECTTSLKGSAAARTNNVNLALGYFNFLEVEPGERISFNKVVGRRTEKNGFFEATEYAGTTVTKGVGGGVCQASTTVYGAVIRAGLEIKERYPHTMVVGYVEASQDAAVSNDNKDLKFVNNTDGTLIFFAWTDIRAREATVKIYGKPVNSNVRIGILSEVTQTDIRGDGISYQEDTEGTRVWYTDDPPVLFQIGKPGLRSTAYRVYYDVTTGEEISREKLSSDYYASENDVYLIGVHPRE